MTVSLDGHLIRLEGEARVEEAETLVRLVQEGPGRVVDIGKCTSLHGAVAQVLLSFRLEVTGSSEDPFLRDLVSPNFALPDGRD